MKRTQPPASLLALCLVLSVAVAGGCATGGSGGGAGFRKDIGKVMIAPLQLARDKIYGKYHIPMYRETDTERTIFWESQWMPRPPAPEESDLGATGGRNRVFIRGTYAEERMDGTPVLRVRFEVENQIQTDMNPAWHPGPMPPAVEERFQEVYDDLMMELRAGIIR